jgi:hypothetical protein
MNSITSLMGTIRVEALKVVYHVDSRHYYSAEIGDYTNLATIQRYIEEGRTLEVRPHPAYRFQLTRDFTAETLQKILLASYKQQLSARPKADLIKLIRQNYNKKKLPTYACRVTSDLSSM